MGMGKGRVCAFASECRKCFGLRKECARKGTEVNVLAFDRKAQRKYKCSQMCQRALTQNRTLEGAAYLSEVTALPLRPSHSLVMPSAV